MPKSRMVHLSAILAAGAISLPLLASTTSAFATTSESTTTSLTFSTSVVYGAAEASETFSATVTGVSGDGYPEGTVAFNYGSTPTMMCSSSTPTATTSYTATYSCSLGASQLPAATYTDVDAVYIPGSPSSSDSADFTYTASTSATQSLTVSAEPESSSITLATVTSPITYGSEASESFSATVTGVSGDGYPEGTVVFNYGSTPTMMCSSSSTPTATTSYTATYSCSLGASQLPPSTYTDVDAVYTPGTPSSSNSNYSYSTSTSTPQSFTVSPASAQSTTTSLTLSLTSVTYGSEASETFSATVTGVSGDGYPEGTVAFNYGSTPTMMCSSSSSPTATTSYTATYSCSLGASQLPPSTYTDVDAVYTPGTTSSNLAYYAYTTSTSSPFQAFSVGSVSTTTSLSLSLTSVAYGSETSETFSGTVTGVSGDGYPEGTVAVYSSSYSSTPLCIATLLTGSGYSASYSCSLTADELAAGSYTGVSATYQPGTPSSNGSVTYTTSTSYPLQAFSVGAVNTTTVLGLSLTSVPYSSEASEIFTISVTGQIGDGYPEGTVAVYDSTAQLCSATLTYVNNYVASATCSLTAYELTAGAYDDVFATYTPGIPSSNLGYTYTTSTSYPVQAFSVGAVTTTTGLGLSLTSVPYSSETSEIFTVSVTGLSGDGYPEGTVEVYNSTTELCIATLAYVSTYSSSASCSLTATRLAPAAYTDVFATYTPGIPSSNLGYGYTTSTSYPVRAFSVIGYTTETTTTRLELSAAQVTYGDEQAEHLSVSVLPQHSGTAPTGTVTISGTNCQITLSAGKGSCKLPPAYLNTGNHHMVATYLGSSDFRHSASATQTVTIATETTTTSLKLSAVQVTYGDEQAEQLSVSVSPKYSGTTPTGTVTISGANCQITLSGGKGSCKLPPAYFSVGNHHVAATYVGSSDFRHSASATQTVVVVK